MRIGPSLPLHVRRAYGMPSPPTPAQSVRPASATPTHPLAAAKVAGPVDFDAPADRPAAAADTGALQLYRRVADRIEAAVGVELGRRLDVSG
jgi:hypothetical protein